MKLKIPENAIPGLKLLAELQDERIKALFDYFNKIEPKFLWEHIIEVVDESHREEITEVIKAIKGLYALLLAENMSLNQLVSDVVDATKEAEELKNIDVDVFAKRLTTVLNFDNTLGVTAKASDVMVQHGNVLIESRIITDIRPVFNSDVTVKPPAAVIVHNLKLTYISDGDKKEFFVALDSSDIDNLVDVIKRAKQKEKRLTEICRDSSIRFIEVK